MLETITILKERIKLEIFGILIILVIVCAANIKLFAQNNDSVSIICVSKAKLGESIPVLVKFIDPVNGINRKNTGKYNLVYSNNGLAIDTVYSKMGIGSILTTVESANSFSISIEPYNGSKTINIFEDIPQIILNGEISTNTSLTNDYDYIINNDLHINAGVKLLIEDGTRLFFGENVNLFIHGVVTVTGTESNPVLFSALDISKPWGGVILNNNNATDSTLFLNTFFIKGGGNSNYVFGHSNSQAIIKAENSKLVVDHCYFLDNVGKCFGSLNSKLTIIDSYLTRSDTGGEFAQSIVKAKRVYVIDIPNNDTNPIDDDNDAMYFNSVHSSLLPSVVDSCVFVTGQDDCIDQNGAILDIRNCWIQDYYHEGIAASNTNRVDVFNCLIKDCEQGIEAGYGNPQVYVNHCVVIDNAVGIRFGDSYNWGCTGKMDVTNSIMYNNVDNVLNYDIATQGEVSEAIVISYSITNDTQYDNSSNCIVGVPLFDDDYFLIQNSPGKGLSSTHLDMGLYNPSSNNTDYIFTENKYLLIAPNPVSDYTTIYYFTEKQSAIKILIRNTQGVQIAEILESNVNLGNNSSTFNASSVNQGLYLVSLYLDNQFVESVKMIVY